MAQLIDIKQDFELGNKFLLDVAEKLSWLLSDDYRVIIKYDGQTYDFPDDNKKNILMALSREVHDSPNYDNHKKVFMVLHNYSSLDHWGYPNHRPNVIPLPLGPFINDLEKKVEEVKPLHEREYDFCFVGQLPQTGTRDKFKRCLDEMLETTGDKFKYYVKYTKCFSGGLDHDEYIELLNNSKICLCPQGAFSSESFRFFEAIMLGSVPMVELLPKFWYYEKAPMSFTQWQQLDKNLSLSLNFLNSAESSLVFDQISLYNRTVLNPDWLAMFYKNEIERYNNVLTAEL